MKHGLIYKKKSISKLMLSIIKLNILFLVFYCTSTTTIIAKTNEFIPKIQHSDPELSAQANFLLKTIIKSNCKFKRNFSMHTAKEAVEHIINKYNYFKEDIHTISDFITLCATKSELTGIEYKIICNTDDSKFQEKSASWMKKQILKFHQMQSTKNKNSKNKN